MTGYQGWTNWETWNANLWPMNEEGAYRFIVDQLPMSARECEACFFELYPDGTPDMRTAKQWRRIDWQEVADAWNEHGEELEQ